MVKNQTNIFNENVLSGINWKKVKTLIPTKTIAEIKSFAQNFFYKMKSCKDDNLGIDFSLNSVNSLKDMLYQIKSKYLKTFHKKNNKNQKNISKNDEENKLNKLKD